MERGSNRVAAALLADEMWADDAPRPPPPSSTSAPHRRAAPRQHRSQVEVLLEEQRRYAWYDGAETPDTRGLDVHAPAVSATTAAAAALSSSAVVTALQDAVLRRGTSLGASGRAGGAPAATSRDARSGAAAAGLHVRRSWKLIEATHASSRSSANSETGGGNAGDALAASSAGLPCEAWSTGRRWRRADDLVQDDALARAVGAELELGRRQHVTGPPVACDGLRTADNTAKEAKSCDPAADAWYASGLRLCLESTRSTASLPSLLSFTACCGTPAKTTAASNHGDAGGDGCASPTAALAFFTFTEGEYDALAATAAVAGAVASATHPTPRGTSSPFTYASSAYLVRQWGRFGNPVVVVDRWDFHDGPHDGGAVRNAGLGGAGGSPSIPTVEEVCAEYHRVTTGVLELRRQRLLEVVQAVELHPPPPVSAVSSAPALASQKSAPRDDTAGAAAPLDAPRPVPPFVTSFDRYALLHPCVPVAASPPSQPAADTTSGAHQLHTSASPVTGDGPACSPSPTAVERLTACTTPHPWYSAEAERVRRMALTGLLRQETHTNVPYQDAAARYLGLAASAAQALQRAVSVFLERGTATTDGDEGDEGEAVKAEGAGLTEADAGCTRAPPPPRPPRRRDFTVQLRQLPGVDPAAWRAAAAAVDKAAAAVDDTPGSGRRKRARSGPLESGGPRSGKVRQQQQQQPQRRRRVKAEADGDGAGDDGSDASGDSDADGHADDDSSEEVAVAGYGEAEHGRGGKGASTQPSAAETTTARLSSHLGADATYAALQAYMDAVVPFRCARLQGAVQAGWLLPSPLALPHTLTEPLDESDVRPVTAATAPVFASAANSCSPSPLPPPSQQQSASESATAAARCGTDAKAFAPEPTELDLLTPILTEEAYQALRQVNAAAVCNRVVSHTGEAVLLSLPFAVPRLHREVEQELERYLYDDSSALMEATPRAHGLVSAIRVAYTQNALLQRFTVRLENVADGLRKVYEDCVAESGAARR